MQTIGLIATYDITGFLDGAEEREVATPWGRAQFITGEMDGRPVAVQQRYGKGMEMVQHLVNFRANIWAFRELGINRVISTDGVGSLRQRFSPGSFVVVDDFIDFTKKGSLSFFEEHGCSVRVDLATPFCPDMRAALAEGASRVAETVHTQAILAAAEGPRFETPAEINMYRTLGADLVCTLLVPEIVLAREAEICLALLAMPIDYAAGLAKTVDRRGPGSMEDVYYKGPHRQLPSILSKAIARIPAERDCPCSRAVPQTVFGSLPAWYR